MSFNHPGWQLTVTLHDLPAPCRHQFQAPVTRVGDRQWRLEPAGPAGPYDVQLAAAGPDSEHAVATFGWVTVNDGARPFRPARCR